MTRMITYIPFSRLTQIELSTKQITFLFLRYLYLYFFVFICSAKVVRRGVKRNPLKSSVVMRRLNPHSIILKTQARANNDARRQARELINQVKSGKKVEQKQLDKAKRVLGVKLRKYKEFKAEKAKKVAAAAPKK